MNKAHRRSTFWLLPFTLLLIVSLACGVESRVSVTPTVIIPTSTRIELASSATPTIPETTPTTIPPTVTLPPTDTPTEQPTLARGPYQCTDPLGCLMLGPKAPIHIAYLLVTQGPNYALGIDSRNGVEIAIDDTGGTILGHPIKFDGVNGGCNAGEATTAALELASDPTIVAVIGPSCSSEARAAIPIFAQAGLVNISPSNTAPDLTDPTSPYYYPGYFRTAHNDKVQGAAAADFAYNYLGVRTAATIHDGTLYADSLQQVFADEFTRLGGTITSQATVDPNGTHLSTVINSIAAESPELIYFPIFMPAGVRIIQLTKVTPGLEKAYLMGADGLYSPDLVSAVGTELEGFMVSSPVVQGPAYEAFLAKYVDKFHSDPINIFHAHAYDAFNILKAAIEKVAVEQTAHDLTYIPRQALRDAIAATSNFPGVTGLLSCSPSGDCANPVIGVYEYHAGEYPPELIWSQK